VSAVSKEGSKIRIKYDDGTSKISKFPDKDVVVDATFNGQNLVAADHKVSGSLWSKINYTKTPHGARLLRASLLRPLFCKAEIERRVDAVIELVPGAGSVALNDARQQVLSKIADLD
jgi:DNA mismatch repair ATPase MutS